MYDVWCMMYDVWCMMYGTWLVYTPPKFTPQKFKKDGWKTTFPFRKVTFLGLQVGIIFTYGQWDMKYDIRAKQNWRYFIDKPRTTSQIIFCDILNHVPLATQQRLCFSVLMSFDEGRSGQGSGLPKLGWLARVFLMNACVQGFDGFDMLATCFVDHLWCSREAPSCWIVAFKFSSKHILK